MSDRSDAASWPLPRADAHNSGRSGAVGAMRRAPRERWSVGTGGDLVSVRSLRAGGDDLVVALAGSVLSAYDLAGRPRWSLPAMPVTRLVAAGDLDGTGAGAILARGAARTLLLLDAASGRERWRWTAPPGTFINDRAGVLLVPVAGGHRLVVAATYASALVAFDLRGGGPPAPAWTVDGPWDAGFGPSIIAADVDGDGAPELVLSSRLGTADRVVGGAVSTDDRVLGRRHGSLYQAVHDLATGERRTWVTYAPDARAYRCARPYGLLTAAVPGPGAAPLIVLASTQVEEYLAVTRLDAGGPARAWGRFIEKDWPRDDRELRVHADGLAALRGDGRLELVVSLWAEGRWVTRVLDPAAGWGAARAELPGRVAWGVVGGPDGRGALVVTREAARATGAPTDLELLDGATLEPVVRLGDVSVVMAEDGPLPPHVAVMARRRGGALLPATGGGPGTGVALRRWSGGQVASVALVVPGAAGGEVQPLVRGDVLRLDPAPGAVLAGRADGTIEIVAEVGGAGGAGGRRPPAVRLPVAGRAPAAIVRAAVDGPELVVELAAGRSAGYRAGPDGRVRAAWGPVPGRAASAVAGTGGPLLLLARSGTGGPSLEAWASDPGSMGGPLWQVPTAAPVDQAAVPLPGGRLAVTLRTGVHTLATELRGAADGALIARLPLGGYLHPPALLPHPDDPLLLLDDHGILLATDLEGRERWRRNWTAAYSMPVTGPFGAGGSPGVLRANGIHGVALLDRAGRRRWRRDAVLWRYAAGRAALVRTPDGPALAMPCRDGILEVIDARTGRLRWTLPLGDEVEHVAVSTGDVDGDGRDELLVGLPDGTLRCVAEAAGPDGVPAPVVRWIVALGAGIVSAFLATFEPGRPAVVVAATTDGAVRVLA